MSVSALRFAGWAALAGGLAGCAVYSQLTPVTIEPGCYAVQADAWPRAVPLATGLTGLPSFVALDTTVEGPAGRRVIVPRNWSTAGVRAQHAYWTEELHGNRQASLLLTFAGSSGNLVASVEAFRDGYAGPASVGRAPAANTTPDLRITLTAISCVGLRLQADAPEP